VDINPATLVQVTAGRDKDNYLMVCKILDENYVLICDGRRRKVETPKKKKLKHLKSLDYSLDRIKEKLEEGNKINNSEVRKSIRLALISLGILREE